MKKKKKGRRSTRGLTTLDEFLKDEGTLEEFEAVAIKEVIAWQIAEAMRLQNLSRKRLAERMKTSRSQIGRGCSIPKMAMSPSRHCNARRKSLAERSAWSWSEHPHAWRSKTSDAHTRSKVATGQTSPIAGKRLPISIRPRPQ
jgi:hypothetical protein